MSPTLCLDTEIRGAVKAASQPRFFDLDREIQGALKIAVAAPVVPPSQPPVPIGAPQPIPQPPAATAPPAEAPPKPAPVEPAPKVETPVPAPATTPVPAPGATGAPAKPGAPAPVVDQPPAAEPPSDMTDQELQRSALYREATPQRQPGAMSQAWSGLKNNWDVALIPVAALAMMFGGKTGKVLGALGLAAGGYGLYSRYQNLQAFGKPPEPIQGLTESQQATRAAEATTANIQKFTRYNRELASAAPLAKQAEQFTKRFQEGLTALQKADPQQAQQLQGALKLRAARTAAFQDYQEALQSERQAQEESPETFDPAAFATTKQAALKQANATDAAYAKARDVLSPEAQGIISTKFIADRHQAQYDQRTQEAREFMAKPENAQVQSTFSALMEAGQVGQGALMEGMKKTDSMLSGMTSRNLQDFRYHVLGQGKPVDWAQYPPTSAEQNARLALAYTAMHPDALHGVRSGSWTPDFIKKGVLTTFKGMNTDDPWAYLDQQQQQKSEAQVQQEIDNPRTPGG